MMRPTTILASFLGLSLAACGGGGGDDDTTGVDAATLPNEGFVPPDHVTMANMDEVEVGPANWACLNTPTADEATTAVVNLTGILRDFQNENEIREGTITGFPGIDVDSADAVTDGPTDNTGAYALDLPAGSTRYGFKLVATDYMDTFLLNQYFEPAGGAQTLDVHGISEGVATALPAIIGLTREPGSGVLAGAMRDCDDHEVSYAVATVSATSGEPDHLDGAVTYYLDTGAGLPVRHDQLNRTDTIGTFAVFQLPVTGTAYIQVWGFVDDADLADGEMTLLAELASPVIADSVITGSIEPLRN